MINEKTKNKYLKVQEILNQLAEKFLNPTEKWELIIDKNTGVITIQSCQHCPVRMKKLLSHQLINRLNNINSNNLEEGFSVLIQFLKENHSTSHIKWENYFSFKRKDVKKALKEAITIMEGEEKRIFENYLNPLKEMIQNYPYSYTLLKKIWDTNVISNTHEKMLSLSYIYSFDIRYFEKIRACDIILETDLYGVKYSLVDDERENPYQILKKETFNKLRTTYKNFPYYLKLIATFHRLQDKVLTLSHETKTNIKQHPLIETYSYFFDIDSKIKELFELKFNTEKNGMEIGKYRFVFNEETFEKESYFSNVSKQLEVIAKEYEKRIIDKCMQELHYLLNFSILTIDLKLNQSLIFKVLSLLEEYPCRGITTYVATLKGESQAKIKTNIGFGAMRNFEKEDIFKFIRHLEREKLLKTYLHHYAFRDYQAYVLSGKGEHLLIKMAKHDEKLL